MCDELKLRNYSDSTGGGYTGYVRRFVAYFMKPPTELGKSDIREYLLHLRSEKLSPSARRTTLAAIKFFYRHTLKRPEEVDDMPFPKVPKFIPANG